MRGAILSAVLGGTLLLTQTAGATVGYFEGFEDDNWTPGTPTWVNYGGNTIEQVATNTGGIASSQGSYHAVLQPLGTNNDVFGVPTLGANSPYSTLGGYDSVFGGGFVVSLDIYLDPTSWSNGQGFDYSVAASKQDGDHLRDFMFHVGVVDGELLVNSSSNTDKSFNSWKLLNENSGVKYTVDSAGWYTFEQVFYDDGGLLSVDFNLYNSSDSLVYTATRTTSDDIATDVGGNRYAWFTYNNIEGLAIDNSSVSALAQTPVPEPATAALGLMGLAGLAMAGRRRRA